MPGGALIDVADNKLVVAGGNAGTFDGARCSGLSGTIASALNFQRVGLARHLHQYAGRAGGPRHHDRRNRDRRRNLLRRRHDYFPPLAAAGRQAAQVFKSSADGGSESKQLMYLLSIAAARSHVRLASAYFVPDGLTVDALCAARARGVRVQVIVPGPLIDEKVVRRASRATWGELLRAGVEIYEHRPTMYHCKQMIVDDRWVSIGSSNLDNRSFRLNDEANVNVLDEAFAGEQIRLFEQNLTRSNQISYERWSKRPWHEKVADRTHSTTGGSPAAPWDATILSISSCMNSGWIRAKQ